MSWSLKFIVLALLPLIILMSKNEVTETATGGVLQEKVFLEISQNSQENTCARVSFLIKLQASGWQLY